MSQSWPPTGSPAPPPPPPWQPAPAAYYAPTNPGTNGLAIASLVLGILYLCGVGSLLAVIFGHMARTQVSRTGQSGNGMAIAGLVLGYIGLAGVILFILLMVTSSHSVTTVQP